MAWCTSSQSRAGRSATRRTTTHSTRRLVTNTGLGHYRSLSDIDKASGRIARVNGFHLLQKVSAVDNVVELDLAGAAGKSVYYLLEDFKLISLGDLLGLEIPAITQPAYQLLQRKS